MNVRGAPGATDSNQLPPGAPFLLDASYYHGTTTFISASRRQWRILALCLADGQDLPQAYAAVLFAAMDLW